MLPLEPPPPSGQRVIIVGWPRAIEGLIQRKCRGLVDLQVLRIGSNPERPRYDLKPEPAARLLEEWALNAERPQEKVRIVVLPYAQLAPPLADSLNALEDLGFAVTRVAKGEAGWPATPRRMDNEFYAQITSALGEVLLEGLPSPETGEHAVALACQVFGDQLLFGEDVVAGVRGLNPQAGPPGKILLYLRVLSLASDARRRGPLGNSFPGWLAEHGVECSTESETVRGSKRSMARRTWRDGDGQRPFLLHLKVADGTHPDRCVRIYFDWCEARSRIVVGWVGRHPE